MTKLKLRFMIIVLNFIQTWSIKNDWMEEFLLDEYELKSDLELKLEEYND